MRGLAGRQVFHPATVQDFESWKVTEEKIKFIKIGLTQNQKRIVNLANPREFKNISEVSRGLVDENSFCVNPERETYDHNFNFPTSRQKSKIIKAKEIHIELPSQPVKYYRHGWQSWSLAAWTDLSPLPVQKPAIYHPLQVDAEHVLRLRIQTAHGLARWNLKTAASSCWARSAQMRTCPSDRINCRGGCEADAVEWFIAFGQENVVFEEYAEQLGNRLAPHSEIKKKAAPRVWCSWYSLYTMIDEAILYKTFDKLGDLPFDVLQVDDGWQMNIGDWEVNEKFPSGMNALADKIKSTGRQAGLWLAPLIATKSSKLFREHADWFLRDETRTIRLGWI